MGFFGSEGTCRVDLSVDSMDFEGADPAGSVTLSPTVHIEDLVTHGPAALEGPFAVESDLALTKLRDRHEIADALDPLDRDRSATRVAFSLVGCHPVPAFAFHDPSVEDEASLGYTKRI